MLLLNGDGHSEYWEDEIKSLFFFLSKDSTMNFTHKWLLTIEGYTLLLLNNSTA